MKRLMKSLMFTFLGMLLYMFQFSAAVAAPPTQHGNCLFFTETGGGQGGFSVCDDANASFRTAFENWGLVGIGYPISQRYQAGGFLMQAFQKGIMQWRPESQSVALINIFDELHAAGVDELLLQKYQVPSQLPPGWDGDLSFEEVVQKRVALLAVRPALLNAYLASSDPLTFYGLPTSEVSDMGNHYAIRLQRSVLQEWKEDVPWARAGEVTIANGGDIAKALGGIPNGPLQPESGGSSPPPTSSSDYGIDDFVADVEADVDQFWAQVLGSDHRSPELVVDRNPVSPYCGPMNNNFAYCLIDWTIYLDLDLLETWVSEIGEFGTVVVVAHEYGHHIQNILGINRTTFGIHDELQADCFAGVYSRNAFDRGLLEIEDLETSINVLYQLGDDLAWFDVDAHGTPQQRQEAFILGVVRGLDACLGR